MSAKKPNRRYGWKPDKEDREIVTVDPLRGLTLKATNTPYLIAPIGTLSPIKALPSTAIPAPASLQLTTWDCPACGINASIPLPKSAMMGTLDCKCGQPMKPNYLRVLPTVYCVFCRSSNHSVVDVQYHGSPPTSTIQRECRACGNVWVS